MRLGLEVHAVGAGRGCALRFVVSCLVLRGPQAAIEPALVAKEHRLSLPPVSLCIAGLLRVRSISTLSSWVQHCLMQLRGKHFLKRLNWLGNPTHSGIFYIFPIPWLLPPSIIYNHLMNQTLRCTWGGWLVFSRLLQPWHSWGKRLQWADQAFCWTGRPLDGAAIQELWRVL